MRECAYVCMCVRVFASAPVCGALFFPHVIRFATSFVCPLSTCFK